MANHLKRILLASLALVVSFIGFLIYEFGRGCTRDQMVDASMSGDVRTIQRLLAEGANPSLVGVEDHYTPLGAATMMGRGDVVRLLIRSGANVNELDDHRDTPIAIARRNGQTEIARILKRAGGHE